MSPFAAAPPDQANQLPFSSYGSATGQLLVYFHGAPGAPAEATVFDAAAKAHGLRVLTWATATVNQLVFVASLPIAGVPVGRSVTVPYIAEP